MIPWWVYLTVIAGTFIAGFAFAWFCIIVMGQEDA